MKQIKVKYKIEEPLNKTMKDLENRLEKDIYTHYPEIYAVIKSFLKSDGVTKKQLKLMRKIIILLKYGYENGHVVIPDEIYDKTLNKFKQYEDEPVIGDIITRREVDTAHQFPNLRGTLHKANYIYDADIPKDDKTSKSLEYYFRKWFKCANISCDNGLEMVISLKYDGSSVIVTIDAEGKIKICITRGDESSGVDLTSLFKHIKFKNHKKLIGNKSIGLKTEIVMTKENFESYVNEKGYPYANLRSAVVSIITSLDGDMYSKYLTMVPLFAETADGKEIPPNLMNNVYSTDVNFRHMSYTGYNLNDTLRFMEDIIQDMSDSRENLKFAIDGIVIDIKNPEVISKMGRKNSINEYQVAYKFPSQKRITTVRRIEVTVGRTGLTTPMVFYDAVDFNGTVHFKSSLSSYDRFEQMDLKPGDVIEVTYNNDVMPYVWKNLDAPNNKNNKNKPFKFPEKCVCGSELKRIGANYFCHNLNCTMKSIGGLTWFCQTIGIKNFSEKTIGLLINKGLVKDVTDLLNLTREDLKGIPGFADKKINSLVSQLEEIKSKPMSQKLLCTSLGISGNKTCEEIMDKMSLSCIVKHPNDLYGLEIEGISDKKKTKFLLNLKFYVDTGILEKLLKILNIRKSSKKDILYKVCFTGFRDKDLSDFLNSKKIEVTESLSGIKYLVIKEEGHTSSKIDKAKKKGIEVVTKNEFMEIVGY